MDIEISVVSHKAFIKPRSEIYIPLYVGKKEFCVDDGNRDDNGENIADKNFCYCELTGLYWLWKNELENVKYIGICHYRRYFSFIPFVKSEVFYLGKRSIENIMKSYDIILPWKSSMRWSVRENYYLHGAGKEKDLKILRNIIKKRHLEYLCYYDCVLNGKQASYCNMFVMSSENTKKYCEWLFDILFAMEPLVDISHYSPAEARIYGYLSEILINVWVLKNKMKIKYIPVIQNDRSLLCLFKGYINHYRGKC